MHVLVRFRSHGVAFHRFQALASAARVGEALETAGLGPALDSSGSSADADSVMQLLRQVPRFEKHLDAQLLHEWTAASTSSADDADDLSDFHAPAVAGVLRRLLEASTSRLRILVLLPVSQSGTSDSAVLWFVGGALPSSLVCRGVSGSPWRLTSTAVREAPAAGSTDAIVISAAMAAGRSLRFVSSVRAYLITARRQSPSTADRSSHGPSDSPPSALQKRSLTAAPTHPSGLPSSSSSPHSSAEPSRSSSLASEADATSADVTGHERTLLHVATSHTAPFAAPSTATSGAVAAATPPSPITQAALRVLQESSVIRAFRAAGQLSPRSVSSGSGPSSPLAMALQATASASASSSASASASGAGVSAMTSSPKSSGESTDSPRRWPGQTLLQTQAIALALQPSMTLAGVAAASAVAAPSKPSSVPASSGLESSSVASKSVVEPLMVDAPGSPEHSSNGTESGRNSLGVARVVSIPTRAELPEDSRARVELHSPSRAVPPISVTSRRDDEVAAAREGMRSALRALDSARVSDADRRLPVGTVAVDRKAGLRVLDAVVSSVQASGAELRPHTASSSASRQPDGDAQSAMRAAARLEALRLVRAAPVRSGSSAVPTPPVEIARLPPRASEPVVPGMLPSPVVAPRLLRVHLPNASPAPAPAVVSVAVADRVTMASSWEAPTADPPSTSRADRSEPPSTSRTEPPSIPRSGSGSSRYPPAAVFEVPVHDHGSPRGQPPARLVSRLAAPSARRPEPPREESRAGARDDTDRRAPAPVASSAEIGGGDSGEVAPARSAPRPSLSSARRATSRPRASDESPC